MFERPTRIAIHYRHGDALKVTDDHLKGALELPLPTVTELLETLLNSSSSVLFKRPVVIDFYSQGRVELFESFRMKFPNTNFLLEPEDAECVEIITHFDGMVQADVLVASPSAFSSLVAALNSHAVVLAPEERNTHSHTHLSQGKQMHHP